MLAGPPYTLFHSNNELILIAPPVALFCNGLECAPYPVKTEERKVGLPWACNVLCLLYGATVINSSINC